MKITKRQLKNIIREVIEESNDNTLPKIELVTITENLGDERAPGYGDVVKYDFEVLIDGKDYYGTYNEDTDEIEWDWNGHSDDVPDNADIIEPIVIDKIFNELR